MNVPNPLRVHAEVSAGIGVALLDTMPQLARRRGVLLALVGRGPTPPWCSSTTALDAMVAVLVGAGVPTSWCALGRAPADIGALAKLSRAEGDRRTLELAFGEHRCCLPRGWVGRHLVLVTPMIVDEAPATEAAGPLAHGLRALARVTGHEDLALASRVVAEVFAGYTWLVDAEQLLLRARRATARARARPLARVYALGGLGHSDEMVRSRADAFDAWLLARAHGRADAPLAASFIGRAAAEPWPRVRVEPVSAAGPLWSPRPRTREVRRP